MRLVILLLQTLFSHSVTTGRKCSETSCCAGFRFDASGVCIVCPPGLYGVQCSTPCLRGFYGELCKDKCQCPVEFCNASIGCIIKHEKELPGPPILYIVIPVSAGLFFLFLIICIVVCVRTKRDTSHSNSPQLAVDEYGYEMPAVIKPTKTYYKSDSSSQSVHYSPPKLYPKDWKINPQ